MAGKRDAEFSARLRRVLAEIGYVQGRRIRVRDAARAISLRTAGEMSERQLKRLLYSEAPWSAATVRKVADGLMVDVRELLYDPGQVPGTQSLTSRRKKLQTGNVWDEIAGVE